MRRHLVNDVSNHEERWLRMVTEQRDQALPASVDLTLMAYPVGCAYRDHYGARGTPYPYRGGGGVMSAWAIPKHQTGPFQTLPGF
jgi:hypothetical protein